MDKKEIALLFRKENPISIATKNTSHGNGDYRETLFVEYKNEKIVIKLAENGFTDEEHLSVWMTIAKKYKELGYYCPQYIKAINDIFPRVLYNGHQCIAYGEEYSRYKSAKEVIEERFADNKLISDSYYSFFRDAILMNARVAAQHYDYTNYPSGYCMFEVFDPSDKTDETTEDAIKWKKEAEKLPEKFQKQITKIWSNWLDAREQLSEFYFQLPTSVFQADINDTNVLLDEEGNFRGVYDFNIGGREVFINLIFREVPYVCRGDNDVFWNDDFFATSIKNALSIISEVYKFSELEKKAAPLLYKCIKPLWWNSAERLKKAGSDEKEIKKCLDFIEYEQNRIINFSEYM